MLESTNRLAAILSKLTSRARARAWSDSEWARHAGLPKETLCRLRSRDSCDFRTLDALAWAVDGTLDCRFPIRPRTADGLWPLAVDAGYEDELLDLVNAPVPDERRWRALGPAFFMAGIARAMADVEGQSTAAYLALADTLHPGIGEPAVYERWLSQTPWSPVRWLSRLQVRRGASPGPDRQP